VWFAALHTETVSAVGNCVGNVSISLKLSGAHGGKYKSAERDFWFSALSAPHGKSARGGPRTPLIAKPNHVERGPSQSS